MRVRPHHRTIGLAIIWLALPVSAFAPQSPAGQYVHARAAEMAGDTARANAGFAALLARNPASMTIAARAYRQAMASGDIALALRAARLLDAQQALPADAHVLFAVEQVRTRNWAKAREATERLAQDRVFAFLAPFFRAWIACGSGEGDALALLDAARDFPLAAPYRDEQRAFLLIALGRRPEAEALVGAGMRLPAAVAGLEQALGLLLSHLAIDFQRQQYLPIGLSMAQMGVYVAPDHAAGWLVLANLLRAAKRADLAIAALRHIDAGDPLASNARAMRIGALNDSGRGDEALAEALAAARRDGAGVEDWGRVGELYLAQERPADAAKAFAAALQAAGAANAPATAVWPLLLQQGGALSLAGDWAGAKAALGRAYALAPDQAIVLNQLGYSQIEHKEDVDRAATLIAQASKLRPDDPAIIDSLGWVTYLLGKPSEAAPLLEKAAAGDPGEPTINEHLGDVYWALGRVFEARYAWRAALLTAADKDRARLTTKIDTGLSAATAAP